MRGRTSSSDNPSEDDTVAVGMVDGRDRSLLADWLASIPDYSVVVFDATTDVPAAYDICLLDPSTLDAHRETLLARDSAADPVYLPHVLLDADTAADTVDHAAPDRPTEEPTANLVDDVFSLPMEQARLHQRVENLLQTRRASRRLAEREEQYRELVALTPESILLVDDGTVVYANEAAATLFDAPSPSDLHGRRLDSLVEPTDSDALNAVLADVRDGTDSTDRTDSSDGTDSTEGTDGNDGTDSSDPGDFADVSFTTTGGRRIHAAVSGVTVTFEGDRVVQLVVRDVTDQRRRQERLDLFGRAIQAADQGITIADAQQPDTPVVYANDGFQRITRYALDDVLGRNCRFLQGANTDPDDVAALRDAVDRGVPVTQDVLNYRKDGTSFWNRVDIVPIEDGDGTVTHFLGFQRDVTDSKQREQRLSVLNRVLRHNLRNKVSLILGYADTVEATDRNPTDATTQIRTAAEALLDISDQVREFDTVLSATDGSTTDFDLAAVVADAADRLRERRPDIDLSVTTPDAAVVDSHPALPTAIEDLLALLGGAPAPAATVTVRADDTYVYLDVTDRGDAIPRADLEVVAHDVETPLEHLQGVQLWLLRWTVEQSRGEITVDLDADHPVIHLQFAASPDTASPDTVEADAKTADTNAADTNTLDANAVDRDSDGEPSA